MTGENISFTDGQIEAIKRFPEWVERESAWIDSIDPTLREEESTLSTEEVCRRLGIDEVKFKGIKE